MSLGKRVDFKQFQFKLFNYLNGFNRRCGTAPSQKIIEHLSPTEVLRSSHSGVSSGEIIRRQVPRQRHSELFTYMEPRETLNRRLILYTFSTLVHLHLYRFLCSNYVLSGGVSVDALNSLATGK